MMLGNFLFLKVSTILLFMELFLIPDWRQDSPSRVQVRRHPYLVVVEHNICNMRARTYSSYIYSDQIKAAFIC